jgi:mRNA-degrading endonuclease RelE of RelBE toxin-antitoxin system
MKIETTAWFDKQIKRLVKKHASIAADFAALLQSLEDNPTQGVGIRRGAYKVRMPITSKGKGKSGGARVITYIRVNKDTLYLLDIYDKSERENIDDEDLDYFIDQIESIS